MNRADSEARGLLILASTSPYRRILLARLGLPFEVEAPGIDEAPLPDEAPQLLAQRLALSKADVIASKHPGAWVIGSDQVASLEGALLGKPGSRATALAQLAAMSGQRVEFFTALSLLRAGTAPLHCVDVTTVTFRTLHDDEIARYVDAEQPLDCAGSFKAEGLGITLFDAINCSDPTALIGLPLIATARLLRLAGFRLP